MKKILKLIYTTIIFILMFSCITHASDSEKKINIDEYMQAPDTMNIMESKYGDGKFYIANFNYEANKIDNSLQYYQAICIYNPKYETLFPLNAKKISQKNKIQIEELVNRDKSIMLWTTPVVSLNFSDKSKLYSPYKDYIVKCSGFTDIKNNNYEFKNVAIIEITNPNSNEKMLQYLAKNHGVVKIEAIFKDGDKIEIANLYKIKELHKQDIEDFINKYFK